jgi:hypothetical protein
MQTAWKVMDNGAQLRLRGNLQCSATITMSDLTTTILTG